MQLDFWFDWLWIITLLQVGWDSSIEEIQNTATCRWEAVWLKSNVFDYTLGKFAWIYTMVQSQKTEGNCLFIHFLFNALPPLLLDDTLTHSKI